MFESDLKQVCLNWLLHDKKKVISEAQIVAWLIKAVILPNNNKIS